MEFSVCSNSMIRASGKHFFHIHAHTQPAWLATSNTIVVINASEQPVIKRWAHTPDSDLGATEYIDVFGVSCRWFSPNCRTNRDPSIAARDANIAWPMLTSSIPWECLRYRWPVLYFAHISFIYQNTSYVLFYWKCIIIYAMQMVGTSSCLV